MNYQLHKIIALVMAVTICLMQSAVAAIDEDQLGAWYMYFFNTRFDDSQFGLQGDVQYRNWDLGGDLEQLLIRGGLTWTPQSSNTLFTIGYGNITTGEFGSSDDTSQESRIYQEALFKHTLGSRVFIRHRFRFEQRWVEDQDFRTRFRYAIFADVPLNRAAMENGAIYFAFYDEIFINGEHDIGGGRKVDSFDRNRLYMALGYRLSKTIKLQGGYMHQSTDSVDKGQLQLSLHHSF